MDESVFYMKGLDRDQLERRASMALITIREEVEILSTALSMMSQDNHKQEDRRN